MAAFFEVEPDDVGAWRLSEPEDDCGHPCDYSRFIQGERWHGDWLKVGLAKPGWIPDVTLVGPNVPIVKGPIADVLARYAGGSIQRIPLQAPTGRHRFELINVLSVIECLDEQRCGESVRWLPSEQPANLRRYKRVVGIKVDESRVGTANVLRIKFWEVALLVSDELRKALMSTRLGGVSFTPL